MLKTLSKMKRLLAFGSICVFVLCIAAIPISLGMKSFFVFDRQAGVPSLVWYVMLAAVVTFSASLWLPKGSGATPSSTHR